MQQYIYHKNHAINVRITFQYSLYFYYYYSLERIKPLGLPSAEETISDGATLTVSGFGATADNMGSTNILRFVQVHSISQASCRSVYGSSKIWDGLICAKGNTIEATCEVQKIQHK